MSTRPLPETLSLRVVNQYRHRDVFAYLGLRYYLENQAARRDIWAYDVATSLLKTRSVGHYFSSQHFKEFSDDGTAVHRPLFVPGPTEAYGETALLAECGKHREFDNPDCVFSYQLAPADYRVGVFVNYFAGLHRRQESITKACVASSSSIARYVDAKKFYPSIRTEVAETVWKQIAAKSGLDRRFFEVGDRLIADYGVADNGRLLTGPMFSHLLANLVMRGVDLKFSDRSDVRYVRYVDDITLIGSSTNVIAATSELRSRLGDLGIELHGDDSSKFMDVPAKKWLEGRDDFGKEQTPSWMHLVRCIKQLLVKDAGNRDLLQQLFADNEIRFPVKDYSQTTRESGYLRWFVKLAKEGWFRRKVFRATPYGVLRMAVQIRERYQRELDKLIERVLDSTGYDRKRLIPMIRFRCSRLIYLATTEKLRVLAGRIKVIPEFKFHAAAMRAVATGDIDQILGMGVNAAQAVSQPMRASGMKGRTTLSFFPKTNEQSLAVFLMNGVPVEFPRDDVRNSDLLKFAEHGCDRSLFRSVDLTLQEYACLHGLGMARHAEMFETAFDEDETLALDAIEQLNQSASQG